MKTKTTILLEKENKMFVSKFNSTIYFTLFTVFTVESAFTEGI